MYHMNALVLLTVIVLLAAVGYVTHFDIFASAASSKTIDFEELTKDPKFVKSMLAHMKKNHDFTQNVITSMLKDPALRLQIIGHMSENKDAMKQMTDMIKSGTPMKVDHSKMAGMKMPAMKMNNSKTTSK